MAKSKQQLMRDEATQPNESNDKNYSSFMMELKDYLWG